MEIYAQFNNGRIIPEYNTDYDKMAKIKPNTSYKVSITRPRNVRFHRKFFALLNLAYQNQETFDNIEHLRYWVTMKAGYYNLTATPSGEMFTPKSISFSSMNQEQFDELYSKSLDVIIRWMGISEQEIQQQLIDFM
jgi:hypothetical protein